MGTCGLSLYLFGACSGAQIVILLQENAALIRSIPSKVNKSLGKSALFRAIQSLFSLHRADLNLTDEKPALKITKPQLEYAGKQIS